MLAPDLKSLAHLIDPNNEGGMYEMGTFEEVDISHLDYGYVRECKNDNNTRSGKEGSYPDLELFIKKRLAELDSTRFPMPLTEALKREQKQAVDDELKDWIHSIAATDEKLKSLDPIEEIITDMEVRSTANIAPLKPILKQKSTASRIKSSDYRSWDLFNVDEELEKIDSHPTLSAPAVISKTIEKHAPIPPNLSIAEREQYSVDEKMKGNDCLRAKEYDQALYHYNTSLKLHKTMAVLNNRALTYLKLEKYSDCVADCTSSLQFETNFKALLRRASGYFHIGKYQDAVVDIDDALELDGGSKEATELRVKIMDKWRDVDGTITSAQIHQGSQKIKIEEIDEYCEPEADLVKRKICIEEVETDSDNDV